jgi:hypothetical protein
MIEGAEAFNRFKKAAGMVLAVPKSAIPNAFSKPRPKSKKRPARKG